MRGRGIRLPFFFFLLALSGTSCASTSYLWQALRGQMSINHRARPIADVLRDESTDPETLRALRELPRIKDYGRGLGLSITGNYSRYLDLKQDAVIWAVSGCQELKFESKLWTFPIVGSIPYLGWFDEKQAHEFAAGLKKEGWEVHVRGVPAYSTLGYFDDPLLNTMLGKGEIAMGNLTNIILHESVHATVYVAGQAVFNESLASFVADEMTPHYLEKHFGAASVELAAYQNMMAEGEKRRQRLNQSYLRLSAIYESQDSVELKRSLKKSELEQLQKDMGYQNLPNNAFLMGYKTYRTGYEDFRRLFLACGRNWQKFLSLMSRLKPQSFKKVDDDQLAALLQPLTDKKCAQ